MEKTVVVTGAAAGIGLETTRRFAAEGWRVGAYDVDEAGLQVLAAELGDSVVTGRLDVRSPEEWEAALSSLLGPDGHLDVLVNNAGILRGGEFAAMPLADHHLMVDVNVTGVVNGCHAAYPHLARTPGSAVVNLCSASAIYGQAELATYSATKFAVRGLSEALDLEWRRDGIRVRALWPLFVETAMTHGLDIGSTRSLGVRLKPADVADAVWRSVQPRTFGVHHPVGLQAKALFTAASLGPSWVVREVNRRIQQR